MSAWRWLSRHPVVSVIVGLVLVASAGGAVLLSGSDPAEDPGKEAWSPWPVRGDLAGDPDLVAKAAAVVAYAEDAPHPHVLWIGRRRQHDTAYAFVAVATEMIHTKAATAVLYKLDVTPSTGLVIKGFGPPEWNFRTSDLGIELADLINDVPRLDSEPAMFPVLTAAGVDKVEFHTPTTSRPRPSARTGSLNRPLPARRRRRRNAGRR
jgi:hypothetical protein